MSDDRLTWPRLCRRGIAVLALFFMGAASGSAQWFNQPSPRAPRTASGEIDLLAPTPRLANGKPDLSGVWMTGEPACVIRGTAPVSEPRKLTSPLVCSSKSVCPSCTRAMICTACPRSAMLPS